MIYESLCEKIMQHFSAGSYTEEIQKAKALFFESAGLLDEATDDFELKMTQFMDWYVFSRPLQVTGQTPVQSVFIDDQFKIEPDEELFYKNLAATRHSLFDFIKLSGKQDLYVKDILSGYRMVIKNSPVSVGFNKGELFEARLIPHDDSFVFTKSFCFHPPQASKFILKEAKKLKKIKDDELYEAREDLLFRLFKMKNKFDQYRHVPLAEIYTNESKLKF